MADMSQIMEGVSNSFDRLPPHSIEAERCLLAAMMLDKDIIGHAVESIERDAFYQADHQILYEVIIKLYEQNRPIDAVIVREELSKRQQLDEIGGLPYLVQILNSVPSAAHGAHYAEIVRDKYMLRQLIAASNDILRDCYTPTEEKSEYVVDKAEKRIFDIAQKRIGGSIVPLDSVLHEVFDMIANRGQRGLETGFYDMDDMLNGLQNGEMIIVAARPSMGKTAFAMNLIEGVAGADRPTRISVRGLFAGNVQAATCPAFVVRPWPDRFAQTPQGTGQRPGNVAPGERGGGVGQGADFCRRLGRPDAAGTSRQSAAA